MVLSPRAKVIVINDCLDCPHRSHTGSFTSDIDDYGLGDD